MFPENKAPAVSSMVTARVVPLIVIASASKVPCINASLNCRLLLPKSISASVTGKRAPSINLIWSAAPALNKIVLSVAKSMSLSASLPTTKLVFSTEVIAVCAPDAPESAAHDIVPEPFVFNI